MSEPPDPPTGDGVLPVRFRVSRVVVVLLALGASAAFLSAGRGLLAGAYTWPGLYVSVALGVLCLVLVVRWLVYRVDVDAEGVRVRALRGGTRWAWRDITRLGLDRQGVPRLVVRAAGASRRLPAWGLTVQQPAATPGEEALTPEQALQLVARQVGVEVVVRDVDGQVRRPPAAR